MNTGTRRVPGNDQTGYFDFRRCDPTDPDCKPILEHLIECHPDPYCSKKALCADEHMSVDSWRKYMAGTFGPGIGLVDRLMRRTRCYRILYWLAKRHGFLLVEETAIHWDQRKKLRTEDELDRTWVELRSLLHKIDYQPGKKLAPSSRTARNKALKLVNMLGEQFVGLRIALENINPQIDLFTAEED